MKYCGALALSMRDLVQTLWRVFMWLRTCYFVFRIYRTCERPCALALLCGAWQAPRRSIYIYIYIYIRRLQCRIFLARSVKKEEKKKKRKKKRKKEEEDSVSAREMVEARRSTPDTPKSKICSCLEPFSFPFKPVCNNCKNPSAEPLSHSTP